MVEENMRASGNGNESIISELMQDFAKKYPAPRTELIERGRVRDFLLAMDEPVDIEENDPVPPLFLLTLCRTRRPQPSRGTSINAGDEFEFHSPVFVGDRITVERKVKSLDEKQGRNGLMYRMRTETAFRNQNDDLVAVSRGTILRWGL